MPLLEKLLCGRDPDVVFAYKTVKVVRIVDRRLGIIHRTVQFAVLVYIVCYVFLLNKGYAKKEQARGTISTVVTGRTYSEDEAGNAHVWDNVDAIYPPVESGALFVVTKVVRTKQQQEGYCTNSANACKRDKDCKKNAPISLGKCNITDSGCTELMWCPQSNINKPWTTTSRMETVDHFEILIKATITFPGLEPSHTFSTMDRDENVRYPSDHANVFLVKDLLDIADTSYSAVAEEGTILGLRMDWNCNLDFRGCQPTVSVKRLDAKSAKKGFTFRRADYYRNAGGKMLRDESEMTGIRIFLTSAGLGRKTSPIALILQLSSGLALLSLATISADFLMQYALPERKHYRKYKIEETPDFSTIRDKQKARSREKKRERYLKHKPPE